MRENESVNSVELALSWLRRARASHGLQIGTVAIGIVAMSEYSVAKLQPATYVALRIILTACLAFFAAQWIAQIAVFARAKTLRPYVLSGAAIVDALVVLPVPIALALGVPGPTAWLFVTLWLFRLAGYVPGLARLGRVIKLEARPLISVLVIFVMLLFFGAVLLHLLEREVQPGSYGDVPLSLWWAVATLTTTGYGDAVPATDAGRLVAALVMISGLGVFGLLTGILATGFVEESRREAFVQNWSVVKNVPFFQSLEPAGLIEIARMLRRWDVSEGTTIVRRGREGDCMYFVASGEVQVEVTPPVRLGPGAFFGEMVLLGNTQRTATVTASLPSTLLILEAADFRTFAAHHPSLAEAIEMEAKRRSDAKSGAPAH
jgi:voltage-gated potassium channel